MSDKDIVLGDDSFESTNPTNEEVVLALFEALAKDVTGSRLHNAFMAELSGDDTPRSRLLLRIQQALVSSGAMPEVSEAFLSYPSAVTDMFLEMRAEALRRNQ